MKSISQNAAAESKRTRILYINQTLHFARRRNARLTQVSAKWLENVCAKMERGECTQNENRKHICSATRRQVCGWWNFERITVCMRNLLSNVDI